LSPGRNYAHPNLLTYRKTKDGDFPLVLVIGREPNSDLPVSEECGDYDFSKSPMCGLWNMAYRLLALSSGDPGLGIRELKTLCIQKNASPIIIADALPITLKDKAAGKRAKRKAIEPSAIERHVKAVFAHDEVMKRVRIAFLSGHVLGPPFEYASSLYKVHLTERNIPFVETSFFSLYFSPRILREVARKPRAQEVLKSILDEFRTQNP
jgi:hypothetical protein